MRPESAILVAIVNGRYWPTYAEYLALEYKDRGSAAQPVIT